jgi:hypothetical protein
VQSPIQVAQIREHLAGQVAAAAVGCGNRPNRAQQCSGLVGSQVQRRAAGDQIPQ